MCTYRLNCRITWQESESGSIRQLTQGSTINSSRTPYIISRLNTKTPPDNASKAPNDVTGIATRTRYARCAALKSTTSALNETQRPNFVNGSAQRAAIQAAHPVDPQFSYDNDYVNDCNNVLPQDMDSNDFLNVASYDNFDLNTKTISNTLSHKNLQSSSCQFHHRKHDDAESSRDGG